MQVSVSRRQFLKISAGTVAAVAVADKVLALTALQPVIEVGTRWVSIRIGRGSASITINTGMTRPLPGAAHRMIPMAVASGPSSGTAW